MLEFRLVLPGDSAEIASARVLFEEYQEGLGIDLCFQSFQEELDSLPGKYGPPKGKLYLVLDDGALAACGALREIEVGTAEIKRLYVRSAHRRKGIARLLSKRLLSDAAEIGYALVKLDTLERLQGAIQLYENLGFRRTAPYNYNPEADIVYMEKDLKG